MEEGPPPPPPPPSNEIVDITDKIAKSECFVLNAVGVREFDRVCQEGRMETEGAGSEVLGKLVGIVM